MFDYCPFLCPICGNEMDGLRPIHNPFTNDQMIVIDCEHCETHFEFHDSWDEVLAKLKYAYSEFPTDVLMEMSFAALANDLAYQDAELLQEIADLWDVYEYIKGGGRLKIWSSSIGETVRFYRDDGTITTTMLHVAAELVRNREGVTRESPLMGKTD